MGTPRDYSSILMPSYSIRPLNFNQYLHLGKSHKLFQGEFINSICNNEEDPYLYYILSGKINICFLRTDGSSLVIATREAGNVFQSEYRGFASIAGDRLRFIAVENSVIISFTKKQLFDLMEQDRQIMDDLLYVVHMFYATLCHRLMNTACLSSSQRFLTWLDKLCRINTPDRNGHHIIECDLTQQQIADLLFIHLTTCNRLITGLEKEKIIKKTKTHIYVYNSKKINEYLLDESKIIY
ncbi:Crp/Fnr family transcriptional regulator [Desulfitobacterium sp. PCE1]|uniref:cAMP-binding protein n=2 Tax=Desulfitobacterium dehalogenans TaxID=36854 RepID=I4AD39_DESDJ|nr:Crp/Fnr family transcriptional regulator [Desulfitobacterium sp. PCE1]AFM01874.1 cAMP-binding protein [Desulfitobacterium dehalogenans ATCC 51507]